MLSKYNSFVEQEGMPSVCRLARRNGSTLACNLQGSCHGLAETPPVGKSQRYVTLTLPLLCLFPASAFPAERKTTRSESQLPYISGIFNGTHSPVPSSVTRFPGCRISFTDIWRNSLDGGTAGRKVCTQIHKKTTTCSIYNCTVTLT